MFHLCHFLFCFRLVVIIKVGLACVSVTMLRAKEQLDPFFFFFSVFFFRYIFLPALVHACIQTRIGYCLCRGRPVQSIQSSLTSGDDGEFSFFFFFFLHLVALLYFLVVMLRFYYVCCR
jgi:hypothetical protein